MLQTGRVGASLRTPVYASWESCRPSRRGALAASPVCAIAYERRRERL